MFVPCGMDICVTKLCQWDWEQGVWSKVLNDKSELQKTAWSETLMLCFVRNNNYIYVHGMDVLFLHVSWFGESLDYS